jgi:hypothetical protein
MIAITKHGAPAEGLAQRLHRRLVTRHQGEGACHESAAQTIAITERGAPAEGAWHSASTAAWSRAIRAKGPAMKALHK